jgi:tetratricopeptide (TPR) repeat protein
LKRKNIASKSPVIARAEDLCRRGVLEMDRRDYAEALKNFDLALQKIPGNYLASVNRGVCLVELDRLDEGAAQFYSLHKSNPTDALILKFCGITHCQLDDYETGLEFLTRATNLTPQDYESWAFMCRAAAKTGKYVEGAIYATKAIAIEPLKADAYNNLGVALLALARFDDAAQAFQTTLAIDPLNIMAMSNLGTTAEKLGKYEEAVEIYENVLLKIERGTIAEAECKYRASYAYLGAGRLSEGWEFYDYGFIPSDSISRHPKRKFNVPQWTGKPLNDDRLLVWGEQGLGDEFWFLGILNEVRERCKNIIVECRPRLVSLFQRSFPDVHVRASNLSPLATSDYDLHIPAGSLMGIFRNHIDDFKKFKPYIRPDAAKIKNFSERLQPYAGKKLVGICWRSGKVDSSRIHSYLMLHELSEILTDPNYVIVNLQYGDCEEELLRAEQALGIKIVRWSDVDLKDNQEDVAALISQLDVVVSPQSAVAQLSMAIGTTLIIFGQRTWNFLGQERFPWSSKVDFVTPEVGRDIRTVVPRVVASLKTA